jgi:DNA adenine methylase
MKAPARIAFRYHGSKWRLAPWLMGFFPPHRLYLEPFAGSASVLMQKPRAHAECLNDLDDRVVSVFRVLRDQAKASELRRRLELTPFSRAEFEACYTPGDDEIDVARKTIALSFMGFGTDAICRGYRTGFRAKESNGRTLPSNDWANWPEEIPAFVARLRAVLIERIDALELIERMDAPDALIYVDPPYAHSTRSSYVGKHGYRHELLDNGHRALAEVLHAAEGMVVLSGYPSELYDRELYAGWDRHECHAYADGAKPRIEVAWLNPACSAALTAGKAQAGLFDAAGAAELGLA